VLVTPDFHHWHHSSDDEAIDKNYATQFAFLVRLFGTAVKSDRLFPQNYGVVGNYMPESFVRQQLFRSSDCWQRAQVESLVNETIDAVYQRNRTSSKGWSTEDRNR
jgi:hypothetical protein